MQNPTTTGTAVVVGATGIIDQAIAVDLRDPEEARRRLAPAAGATHLFFAAYLPQASC
jgi:hypothetical protein